MENSIDGRRRTQRGRFSFASGLIEGSLTVFGRSVVDLLFGNLSALLCNMVKAHVTFVLFFYFFF